MDAAHSDALVFSALPAIWRLKNLSFAAGDGEAG